MWVVTYRTDLYGNCKIWLYKSEENARIKFNELKSDIIDMWADDPDDLDDSFLSKDNEFTFWSRDSSTSGDDFYYSTTINKVEEQD